MYIVIWKIDPDYFQTPDLPPALIKAQREGACDIIAVGDQEPHLFESTGEFTPLSDYEVLKQEVRDWTTALELREE